MTIAIPSDTTRIFIDRTRFVQAMSTATLQGKLNEVNLNAEVFEMAGRVGIGHRTASCIRGGSVDRAVRKEHQPPGLARLLDRSA